jgi:hypothetical protein
MFPEALDPPIDGLSYLSLDAYAFDLAQAGASGERLFEHVTGVKPILTPNSLFAPLTIPIGSVIKQINVSYQGQPIVSVIRRGLGETTPTTVVPVVSLAGGGGVKTQTIVADGVMTNGATYAVEVFCSAGDSILGMTIGYMPPAQAFVPYLGNDPRALDTRPNDLMPPQTDKVVDLSAYLVPTARAAVVNVTATETGGPGFLAVYRAGISYPGNSSVNFVGSGLTVANGVITAHTDGKITVHTGPASSHVIVDVIGSLL